MMAKMMEKKTDVKDNGWRRRWMEKMPAKMTDDEDDNEDRWMANEWRRRWALKADGWRR